MGGGVLSRGSRQVCVCVCVCRCFGLVLFLSALLFVPIAVRIHLLLLRLSVSLSVIDMLISVFLCHLCIVVFFSFFLVVLPCVAF